MEKLTLFLNYALQKINKLTPAWILCVVILINVIFLFIGKTKSLPEQEFVKTTEIKKDTVDRGYVGDYPIEEPVIEATVDVKSQPTIELQIGETYIFKKENVEKALDPFQHARDVSVTITGIKKGYVQYYDVSDSEMKYTTTIDEFTELIR